MSKTKKKKNNLNNQTIKEFETTLFELFENYSENTITTILFDDCQYDISATSSASRLNEIDTSDYITINISSHINLPENDPYQEIERIRQQEEKEEQLRKENPALQEAWEQYQLIKQLVEDQEYDKYFDIRYKDVIKK